MIKIVLRTSKNDVGTLAVCIKNRQLGINTFVSMHIKMPIKDWVNSIELPKNIYDNRPVAIMDGMSYADLSERIQRIKKSLSVAERSGYLTVEYAKKVVDDVTQEVPEEKYRPVEVSQKEAPMFCDFMQEYITQCETGERLKHRSTAKIQASTLKSYRAALNQVRAFEKSKLRVIGWDDMTMSFYNDFTHFLISKQYSPNTIGKIVRVLKTVLKAAKAMHLTTTSDWEGDLWVSERVDVDNVYIPEDRLTELISIDLMAYDDLKRRAEMYASDKCDASGSSEKDRLAHALKRDIYRKHLCDVRDVFVMGCLTGQRLSDYKRITTDMIETLVGGRRFLHFAQKKTGKDIYVPFTKQMEDILARHSGKLPVLYDQDVNKKIKTICLLLGWTEPCGIKERRGMLTYESRKRFCDVIMTHTARRSFATNAYKRGVSLSTIMAITGHSSEEMLKRYLKLKSKERAMLAAVELEAKGVGYS